MDEGHDEYDALSVLMSMIARNPDYYALCKNNDVVIIAITGDGDETHPLMRQGSNPGSFGSYHTN